MNEPVFCRHCGRRLTPGVAVCAACGFDNAAPAPAPAPARRRRGALLHPAIAATAAAVLLLNLILAAAGAYRVEPAGAQPAAGTDSLVGRDVSQVLAEKGDDYAARLRVTGGAFSTEYAENTILTQRENADGLQEITLSLGPQPVWIEDYTGFLAAALEQELNEAGIWLVIQYQEDDASAKGTILTQDTPAGSVLHAGDNLSVTVAWPAAEPTPTARPRPSATARPAATEIPGGAAAAGTENAGNTGGTGNTGSAGGDPPASAAPSAAPPSSGSASSGPAPSPAPTETGGSQSGALSGGSGAVSSNVTGNVGGVTLPDGGQGSTPVPQPDTGTEEPDPPAVTDPPAAGGENTPPAPDEQQPAAASALRADARPAARALTAKTADTAVELADLAGLDVAGMKQYLRTRQLFLVVDGYTVSDTVPAGQAAAVNGRQDDILHVQLSRGPTARLTVPNILGMDRAGAAQALAQAGFDQVIWAAPLADSGAWPRMFASGTVCGASEAMGAPVEADTRLTVFVAGG